MNVSQAGPEQQEAIAHLLRLTFRQSETFLCPAFLRWKFFSPASTLPGSRSYIIRESEEEIQAHACEWEVSFSSQSGSISGCHVIDWAALPGAKGTGLSVYQHLMKKHELVLAIGGSAQARKLLPRLGFKPHGTLEGFALVVRPWLQYRSRPQSTAWRDTARMARNTVWHLKWRKTSDRDWTSHPALNVSEVPETALHVQASTFSLGIRSTSGLQYLLDCPLMDCTLHVLLKAGAPLGYFLLNQVGGQCRIIDLAVASEAQQDWESAYNVAIATAFTQKTTCEITAVSSLPWLSDVFRGIGFQLRSQCPVLVLDPNQKLLNAPPLHLRMTDSDACFLYEERFPFQT